MTQPSLDMTFDTSLIDTQNPNASFSTTDSDLSEAGPAATSKLSQQLEVTPTPPPKTTTPVQHIPTQDAYDQWAAVYDTDGNMLQAIDDLELLDLLPEFLHLVSPSLDGPAPSAPTLETVPSEPLKLIDLGCGTGRNTAKLLTHPWNQTTTIWALDFSAGMLEIAERKLTPLIVGTENVQLRVRQANCFPTVEDGEANPIPRVDGLHAVDGLISTLVLEHIPLLAYFATLSSLVRSGGFALVTNMHSEMGRISQAGFVNAEGVKVRGESFAYTVEETVESARKAGFEIVSLKERGVTREDVESGRVGERGSKWVGVRVWYGLVLRKL